MIMMGKSIRQIWVKKLTRKACQGNRAVIAGKRPVALLKQVANIRKIPFLYQLTLGRDWRVSQNSMVNKLVGDVKANPRDFYRYINSQKKDGSGLAESDFEKAGEFNGQLTDVFTKTEHSQVPLLNRKAPFMEDIVVSKEGVTNFLKGLNPSKALGPEMNSTPESLRNWHLR